MPISETLRTPICVQKQAIESLPTKMQPASDEVLREGIRLCEDSGADKDRTSVCGCPYCKAREHTVRHFPAIAEELLALRKRCQQYEKDQLPKDAK